MSCLTFQGQGSDKDKKKKKQHREVGGVSEGVWRSPRLTTWFSGEELISLSLSGQSVKKRKRCPEPLRKEKVLGRTEGLLGKDAGPGVTRKVALLVLCECGRGLGPGGKK